MQFQKSLSSVLKLQADVILIQECERELPNVPDNYYFSWIGNNPRKGIAVLSRRRQVPLSEAYNPNLVNFQPILIDEFFFLNVWAFNSRAKKFGAEKSGYLIDALVYYEKIISNSEKVVIAGDFNNGPKWDVPGHRNNFLSAQSKMQELGLASAYHVSTQEKFGSEMTMTHYHHKNLSKGFHIDYLFTNLKISKVDIAPEETDWLEQSDHMPLVVELANSF